MSAPNRIVVFDVSGIIDLARPGKGGRIEVDQPNITIAGQSAPGEGVCLRGGALEVGASNVIVRYLRSRRGFVTDEDMGDAFTAKPKDAKEQTVATGRSCGGLRPDRGQESRARSHGARLRRPGGRDLRPLLRLLGQNADENLSVSHVNRSTLSFCIVARGPGLLQRPPTPPNHSEGSLWGTGAPGGTASMHHMLYAHNRLRNPRTTGGADLPPVLTLSDSVVYDWSEFATHTGSERVALDWLDNTYQPGPSTPAAIAVVSTPPFSIRRRPRRPKVYPRGNVLIGSPAATADNRSRGRLRPQVSRNYLPRPARP